MSEEKPERPCPHTKEGLPPDEWQSLDDHLRNVAGLAEGFASSFEASSWGYLAGLWHDLGKYNPAFQEYLRNASEAHIEGKPGRVDHSSTGGQLAVERFVRFLMISR